MEEEKSSFYDRLGDLLSETLEAGQVNFIRLEREELAGEGGEKNSSTNGNSSSTKGGTSSADGANSSVEETVSSTKVPMSSTDRTSSSTNRAYSYAKEEASSTNRATSSTNRTTSSTKNSTSTSFTRKRVIYKHITPEISKAFRLLDITPSANLEDLKKAYKEKIKYYHPDKFQNNPVMEKVATDKTRQVVEAYALLIDFIST